MAGKEYGSFLFEVTDGVIVRQLTFRIHSSSPTLLLTSQGPLRVFPGVNQPITSRVLCAVTDDAVQSRTVIYTVISGPKLGRLQVKDADDPADLTTFRQRELDEGAIVYRPLANAVDSPWAGIADFILLEVSTAYAAPLRNVTLPVNISYKNLNEDNAHALIRSLPLRIDEGGGSPVEREHVDARPLLQRLALVGVDDIVYILVDAPQHGRLSLGRGHNATSGDRLSPRDLDGDIYYAHDGSETTEDHFRFAVELRTVGNEVVAIDHVITVNVKIRPVNDQTFELKGEAQLQVLQVTKVHVGFNGSSSSSSSSSNVDDGGDCRDNYAYGFLPSYTPSS